MTIPDTTETTVDSILRLHFPVSVQRDGDHEDVELPRLMRVLRHLEDQDGTYTITDSSGAQMRVSVVDDEDWLRPAPRFGGEVG